MIMKSPVSYNRHKPEEHWDVICIGSGPGCLCAAAFLAQQGKRVLVLERHYRPGGYTHIFKRPGFEWDVGVHYIGEVGRDGSFLSRLFNQITGGRLKWADMGEVYDRIRVKGDEYPFHQGKRGFVEGLKACFPNQEDHRSIDQYMHLVSEATKASRSFFMEKGLSSLLAQVAGKHLRKSFMHFAEQTTLDVLHSITQNKRLIAVLTGQYGDYGLPPSESSFAMHAMLVKHYFNGGFYRIGGASL